LHPCLEVFFFSSSVYFYGIVVEDQYVAGEVDLLIVELVNVIMSIVMFKADIITDVSRPGRF